MRIGLIILLGLIAGCEAFDQPAESKGPAQDRRFITPLEPERNFNAAERTRFERLCEAARMADQRAQNQFDREWLYTFERLDRECGESEASSIGEVEAYFRRFSSVDIRLEPVENQFVFGDLFILSHPYLQEVCERVAQGQVISNTRTIQNRTYRFAVGEVSRMDYLQVTRLEQTTTGQVRAAGIEGFRVHTRLSTQDQSFFGEIVERSEVLPCRESSSSRARVQVLLKRERN